MGSKNPKSETQQTFPPWLEQMLKPLIGNSVGRLNQFSQQGNNVLQGKPYQEGTGPGEHRGVPYRYNPGGGLDPKLWESIVRGRNG